VDPAPRAFYNVWMTLHDGTVEERADGGEPKADGGGRRPYSAPRILSREPLESVAAVCAPTPPAKSNPGVCPQGPISS
jgi:hypothetical protein